MAFFLAPLLLLAAALPLQARAQLVCSQAFRVLDSKSTDQATLARLYSSKEKSQAVADFKGSNSSALQINFYAPSLELEERIAATLRAGAGVTENETVTLKSVAEALFKQGKTMHYLARGGFSKVYLVADNPAADLLNNWARLPENARKASQAQWNQEHSKFVLKVRSIDPSTVAPTALPEVKATQEAAIKRDLAVYTYLKEVEKLVRYDGRPLFRAANIASKPSDHARGLLIQEFVPGPTVKELSRAIEDLQKIGTENVKSYIDHGTVSAQLADLDFTKPQLQKNDIPRAEKALEILREAGLISEKSLTEKDLASLQAMEARIQALETFYQKVHRATIDLHEKYGLPVLGHKVENNGVQTGLDYNFGVNVIWDRQAKMFVMIDW